MILEKAILNIYPDAVPNQDFLIMDDGNGPEIRQWKYNGPIPTENELQMAWGNVQVEPVELSPIEKKLELMQQAIDDIILGVML